MEHDKRTIKEYLLQGSVIDWKKGKNVTIKTIKKNQKHKSRGSMRTVTKTIQNDSFFNFFTPPVGNYTSYIFKFYCILFRYLYLSNFDARAYYFSTR